MTVTFEAYRGTNDGLLFTINLLHVNVTSLLQKKYLFKTEEKKERKKERKKEIKKGHIRKLFLPPLEINSPRGKRDRAGRICLGKLEVSFSFYHKCNPLVQQDAGRRR